MKIKTFIKWTDFDKYGNIIGETEHEANSLVKGFMVGLITQMIQTSQTNITDTGGVGRTISTASTNLRIAAPAADATYGLVFGRGTTAVALTDYALVTPITEGTGANQLNYSIVTFDAALTVGATIYFQTYRTVTNNTASTITIEEAGLVFYGTTYKFLMERTLSTKAILAGNGSTCTYKIELSL